MDDESTDILGQRTKPVLQIPKDDLRPGVSMKAKLTYGFVVLLFLYVAVMHVWTRILAWRELSRKLAMRRKHGIPDSDRRPFNVAYAAVIRARQDMEAAERAKAKAAQALPHIDRHIAFPDQKVRQRVGEQVSSEVPRASASARLPGAYISPDGTFARGGSHYPGLSVSPALPSKPARYYPLAQYTPARLSSTGFQENGKLRQASQDFEASGANGQEQSIDVKGRKERGEMRRSSGQGRSKHKRGTKRYLDDETEQEEDYIDHQPRDKRQRKVSLDHAARASEGEENDAMDLDEEDEEAEVDEVADLPVLGRGRKRDRAEAGSTFGEDEEENVSDVDFEDLDKPKRQRKRLTIKGKSDTNVAIRGQKRDRDSDGEATFDDDLYISRKKRGKKHSQNDIDDGASEHSIPDSRSSVSGRKIGEEWTSNGIRWKIGPNGERLRQTLVRKARQKFPMPEDSQHPDRDANFEVFVEKWLTEEEYQDAKARHILAWQDTPKKSIDSANLALDVKMQLPSKAVGKLLLWSSTSTPVASPITGSPSADSKFPGNPFNEPSISLPKRISSSRSSSFNNRVYVSLADSTNGSPRTRLFKVYSKFEKQEMEAEALMKLREIKSKKDSQSGKAQEPPGKESKELEAARNEKENSEKARPISTFSSSSLPVSTSILQPPSQSTASFSFGKLPAEQGRSSDTTNLPSSSTMTMTVNPSTTAPSTPVTTSDSKDKNKDVAPSAAPMFSIPSSSTPSINTGNMFGQLAGSSASTSGTASEDANKGGQASKPVTTFSFAPSGSVVTADSSQPASTKPVFSFGFSAPKQSNEQKIPETASTTQPTQSLNTASSHSLLSRLGPPANNTSTLSTASQTTPTFSFGAPPATSPFTSAPSQPPKAQPLPSVSSASAPTTTPKFSFGFTNPLAPTTAPTPQKQTNSTFPTYTPLNPSVGTTESPKPSTANTAASQSIFSFKSPSVSNTNASPASNPSTSGGASGAPSGPVFSFGIPSNKPPETKTADSTSTTPNNAQTTKPSFNFGFTASPSADNPTNTTNPSNSSTSFGAFGSQSSSVTNTSSPVYGFNGAAKGSPNIFGVGGSSSQSPALKNTSNTSNATSASSGVPSTFGSTGGSSLQPSSNVFGSSSSLNNVFGAAGQPTNGFGTSTATNGAQPPQSGTTNVFGGANAGAFGSTTNKASEAPKPTFSFGNPESSKSSSSSVKPADPSKPLFNFGVSGPPNNSTDATTSNAGAPNFLFNFGAPNKGTAASTTPQASPFGTAGSETKPSIFGSQSNSSPLGNIGNGATNGSIFTGFGSSNTSQ